MNMYAYVGNNPVGFVDPMGLDKWREGWAGLILVGPIDSFRAGVTYNKKAHDWSKTEADKIVSTSAIRNTKDKKMKRELSKLRSGIENVLRHGYFSAQLYRNFTANDAEQILLIHEQYGGTLGTTDSMVDCWNNEVGRKIGLGDGLIEDMVLRAYFHGDLTSTDWHIQTRGLIGNDKQCKDIGDNTSGSEDSSGSQSGGSESY